MGLFKNGVGRPSNETLDKRRKICVFVVIISLLLIGTAVFYTVNYFRSNNELDSSGKNAKISEPNTVSKNVSVKFDINGAKSIGASIRVCTIKGTNTTCSVVAPTITPKDGFEVIGWGTSKNSTTASIKPNTTIKLSSNKTFYAITRSKKPITTTFSKTAHVKSIGATKKSCYKYNGESGCYVIAPSIVADTNYSVVGWQQWHVSNPRTIKPGENIYLAVINNTNYEAIVKYNSKTFYAYFLTPSSSVDSIVAKSSGNLTNSISQVNNKSNPHREYCYTTASSPDKCTINVPKINASKGYTVVGWSKSASSMISSATPGGTLVLNTQNTGQKYYAIAKKNK